MRHVAVDRVPPGREIDVWRIVLDHGLAQDAEGVLSLAERQRAERFRFRHDRLAFRASRVALRVILGGRLGADPGAIDFTLGPHGRPSVADAGDLTFSLSRSAPLALVALTRGRPVGVDIERIRPLDDLEAMAARFFSASEVRSLRSVPEPDRTDAFFACWTQKEAVAKATGVGLDDAIDRIATGGGAETGRWPTRLLDIGAGWAAAVAVERPLSQVALRPFGAGSAREEGRRDRLLR